ncbi:MAG: hypothetical protein ACOH2M_33080 [Cypionkella sp.]
MTSYTSTRDGFILGTYYAKGAAVPLTEAQAKYLVAPYGDAVSVAKAKEPEAEKPKAK